MLPILEKAPTAFAIAAALALTSHCLRAEMSPPARFIGDPEHSLQWHTYMAGEDGITWTWPNGAASAKLTVSGRNGSSATVFAKSEHPQPSYQPDAPQTAGAEDVINLVLDFFASADASGEPLAGLTQTANGLGVVRGVNGGRGDIRCCAEGSREWNRVKDRSAVLPIPSGTVSLTIRGESQTLGYVPGWHLWSPIGSGGAIPLELTTDEAVFDPVLTGISGFLLMYH